MAIEIEKGIEMPAASRKAGPSKYPWRNMEVGDSFFTVTKNSPGIPKEVRDDGFKFKGFPEEKDGEAGWRVFRVE